MEKKKVLVVCEEAIVNELIEFLLEKISYEAEVVDNPKDAADRVENSAFDIIIIGKNKGTVVKHKLAEILYNKSLTKPYIIIYKEPGEIIHREPYVSILNKPTFHEELIDALKKAGFKPVLPLQSSKIDIDKFVRIDRYESKSIHEFFRGLKGNIKFIIKKQDGFRVVGFTMGADFYLVYSELEDPYFLLSVGSVNIATEPLNISEFLNLPLDSNTFKINIRDFIVKSIEKIDDKSKLLSFLPSLDSYILVKAPAYVLKQVEIIESNVDVDSLIEKKGEFTFKDLMKDETLEKIKAVVCMYLLNMIDVDVSMQKRKYDVKIKKSFLKKIIEKIRGL